VKVVIIGAGVVGAAVADELTARGCTDVTVLDRGPLGRAGETPPGGSSSHAPGLVFQTNPAKILSDFARTTVEKLAELRAFRQVGGLEVATTGERLADLRRRHGLAQSWGVPSRLVDAAECAALHPLLPDGAVLGGLHTPTDGLAAAPRAVAAQLARAVDRGARVLGHHRVTDVRTAGGRVTGVVTETTAGGRTRDEIPADVVVSATGFWGPQSGALVDLTIPLLPMAHQYVRTGPVAPLAGATAEAGAPILRHQDRDLYFREHADRIGIGSYAHRPMPVDAAALGEGAMPSVLPFTAEDFAPSWADAVALLPDLAPAGIASGFDGVFSFTPDGMPLVGEHPGVRGFWVAEAVWVTHSCGVARALARWIVEGEPGVDVHACDLNRFDAPRLTPEYVATRSTQAFVEVYDVVHPLEPPRAPRPLRVSPWYARQVELGAVFGEGAGWERPLWFEANAGLPEVARIPGRGEWASRSWSPVAGAEALVTRERAALYDMTPLVRLDVTGPGALDLLQRATSGDMDVAVGRVVYTLLLDRNGRVRSDLTVARLGAAEFRVGANGPLDLDALCRLVDPDGPDVALTDVTGGTCGLGLWGPLAPDVLADACADDLSFGYFRARRIRVGSVPVLALRLSYVGEAGWELYCSAELGLRLWDTLWAAGRRHGLIAAGRSAFGSLRLEKGYRSAGVDMTAEHTPAEAGLGFAVRPRPTGAPARRLVPLLLDDPGQVVMGSEPVFHEGACAGYVTSAAYGYTIDASIAYAWLPAAAAVPGTAVQVEYFGERLPAVVAAEPLVDPEGKRMRS
jgi:dimethylglycine oxidase